MLLIYPPCAKASEPPAGIARLAGALLAHGIACRTWDANLEGQLWLLEQPCPADDTWSRRAERHAGSHLDLLRSPKGYREITVYSTAVKSLNRLLAMNSSPFAATVSLTDYRHATLSPLRSSDLLQAAAKPESNPFYPWFSRRLSQLLEGEGWQSVGFSLNFLGQALATCAMIGFLRRSFPSVRIVLGGGLVTSWFQQQERRALFSRLADTLVCGPGEQKLLELHGIAQPSCDSLPHYDQFPLKMYLAPGPIIPYSAASGCWWNRCSFCPERAEGNRWQPVPPARGVEQLHALAARHKPALLHITDNAITPALMQRLIETPLETSWYGFARFDHNLADAQFCRDLRRSGCVMLKLGLESGSQVVLDSLQKGIDLHLAAKGLENLRNAGIAVYCYLLFGTPAEDEAAAHQTLDFVAQHAECITFLNLAIFNMPLFGDEAAAHGTGLFYEGDLSLYTGFSHPSGWHRGKVRRFLEQEFKRHPAIAPILRRDPPLFTSNHAPFFAAESNYT